MKTKLFYLILILSTITFFIANCSVGPVCGNGVHEVGEQCDDGNTISGDGCSSTCNYDMIIVNSTYNSQRPVAGHNQGTNCLNGCHDGSNWLNHWTIAGTVYTDNTGTTPVSGALITLKNASTGQVVGTLEVDLNGNFYSNDPKYDGVALKPSVTGGGSSGLSMAASILPDLTNAVTGGGSACNQSGCHSTGSSTGTLH